LHLLVYICFSCTVRLLVVCMLQVPLEVVEQDRAYKSRLILQSISSDNTNLFSACVKAENKYLESERKILQIEAQIEKLQAELIHYRNVHVHYRRDYNEHRSVWEQNDSKILGLCLRSLARPQLAHIFQFLVGDSGSGLRAVVATATRRREEREAALNLMLVCRYWLKIVLCDVLRVSLAPSLAAAEEPTVPVDDDA
jgi:hypothetical protein